MSSILVATAREAIRESVLLPLAREGLPVASAADWDSLCRATCVPDTQLVLVDPELPGLRAELLLALAASLGHTPTVRVLGAPLPPLVRVPATERAILRLARQHVGTRGVDGTDRRLLRMQGLGPSPLERLVLLAGSPLPALILGERGTGKERVARVLHQIAGLPGPFVVHTQGKPWRPEGPPGTLYLESAPRHADLRAVIAAAREAGWRVIGGSRLDTGDVAGAAAVKWARVVLPPLRERPDDLRNLATWYLDHHSRRMGLPKRSFDRGLWALLHAHRWPGNHRELEMFVVQALSRVDAPLLRGATLPDELRALLLPQAEAEREAESFEEMARVRLLPVVRAYAPGGEDTLHALVVRSAERALFQLVLARTQGNRKAAAALLGVARNTLQQRIEALGLGSIGRAGEG
ncbi:MAG: helix-turn-helix domain-containing protein [Pseudomonadota bacterium]|nr:helix-turn-helix domain-containing protein [Pseudomonadota bacterium]